MKKIELGLDLMEMVVYQFSAGLPVFVPVPPPPEVPGMAHRGEANQAPANTRPALMRCIEDGLEWAEIDIHQTRDGQHVVVHDARVAGPPGWTWAVAEHTLTELKELDLGSPFAARYAGE